LGVKPHPSPHERERLERKAPPQPTRKGRLERKAPPQPSPKGEGGKIAKKKMKERM